LNIFSSSSFILAPSTLQTIINLFASQNFFSCPIVGPTFFFSKGLVMMLVAFWLPHRLAAFRCYWTATGNSIHTQASVRRLLHHLSNLLARSTGGRTGRNSRVQEKHSKLVERGERRGRADELRFNEEKVDRFYCFCLSRAIRSIPICQSSATAG
jgi:hypothetical protein